MHFNPKAGQKALVIGSGFGGLGVAIRLQAMGFQTTILERRDKAGGRAYVYEESGFRFDAGPTVITAPHTITELFELAGRPMERYVQLLPISPMYRLLWEDGTKFDYTADDGELEAQIKKVAPDDLEGYHAFLKHTKEVFHHGYERLGHVPFLSFWDMIKVAPQLVKLRAYQSVYGLVSRFLKSEKLRQAFSFNSLLIGGNPFKVSSIYTLIHPLEKKWGVFFAKGGTGALVAGLIRLFEDMGGKVHLNADVDHIVTLGGRATGAQTKDGRSFAADLVVCNSDVTHTYQTLLRKEPKARPMARSLARKTYSNSLFVLYFGTNRPYDGLLHHNVIFGKRYKELLTDIFDRGILADDFSLYLHAPAQTDPDLAPKGHQGFYVLSPVPHLGKCKMDWEKAKVAYGESILKYLEEHYMPDLRQHIVLKKYFTPNDFVSELNAPHGAAFSLEPTLQQSAYFRVHNRDSRINGLFFVGAGTHPGAGVPGVLGSAKATAGVIESMIQERLPKGFPVLAPAHH